MLFLFFYMKRVIFLNFISLKTLRSLCTDLIIFLIPLTILWVILPRILGILAPFIAGYLLYAAANPVNKRLKSRLPGGLCAFISLSIISAALFFILRSLFTHLISEITSLTQSGGNLYSETLPFISRKIATMTDTAISSDVLSSFFKAFRTQILDILSKFSTSVLSFAKNIPSMLISVFAAVFTAFFLLKDDSFLHNFFHKFFGDRVCMRFGEIKNSFLSVTLSYLKAQLIIETIIFAVLFTGFFYLGVRYSLLMAFFAALVDAVPILGTGTILVPMALFNFLTNNMSLGWGLLILYGVAILTRQLCEPKIIGNKLGIHPLLTVFALYSGMKLFGIAGLILGPIAAIFIKNLITAENI